MRERISHAVAAASQPEQPLESIDRDDRFSVFKVYLNYQPLKGSKVDGPSNIVKYPYVQQKRHVSTIRGTGTLTPPYALCQSAVPLALCPDSVIFTSVTPSASQI